MNDEENNENLPPISGGGELTSVEETDLNKILFDGLNLNSNSNRSVAPPIFSRPKSITQIKPKSNKTSNQRATKQTIRRSISGKSISQIETTGLTTKRSLSEPKRMSRCFYFSCLNLNKKYVMSFLIFVSHLDNRSVLLNVISKFS